MIDDDSRAVGDGADAQPEPARENQRTERRLGFEVGAAEVPTNARSREVPHRTKVITEYLHSVLVVDDRAEYPRLSATRTAAVTSDVLETSDANGPRPRIKLEKLIEPEQLSLDEEDPVKALDAPALAAAFAKEGLVCGILRPSTPHDAATTVNAARRSDIIILDWSFDADNGETALDLIQDILARDEAHRLRFVVIYTGELSLPPIADRIEHMLTARRPEQPARRLSEHRVEQGGVRISVFGKMVPIGSAVPVEEPRRCSESDLPEKVIEEYAAFHAGLLSTAALEAVSALRRNTESILSRFTSDLDPGFLYQRSLQESPEDAEQQLIDIIVGEIAAVIEESDIRLLVGAAACVAWVRERGVESFKGAFGVPNAVPSIEDFQALFLNGVAKTPRANDVFNSLTRKRRTKATSEKTAQFAPSAELMRTASERFSELMVLRTRYADYEPCLSIGTIVKSPGNDYLLCVLPACDAVRLSEERKFAFVPLQCVGDLESRFDLVIETTAGQHTRFLSSHDVFDLHMILFAPNDAERVRAVRRETSLFFDSVKDGSFQWIAELKTAKAESYAHNVGRQLARPGLDDPEWLRAGSRREQ